MVVTNTIEQQKLVLPRKYIKIIKDKGITLKGQGGIYM